MRNGQRNTHTKKGLNDKINIFLIFFRQDAPPPGHFLFGSRLRPTDKFIWTFIEGSFASIRPLWLQFCGLQSVFNLTRIGSKKRGFWKNGLNRNETNFFYLTSTRTEF